MDSTLVVDDFHQRIAFSPESPLFAKRVNHYGNDLDKLGEFLKSMVKQMRQFCKDLEGSARSADDLGNVMRSGVGNLDSHTQFIPVIRQFGDIFTELAGAQIKLSESLEGCFIKPLEIFYTDTVIKVQAAKQHYFNQREGFDLSIQKYLQSDLANFGRGTIQNQIDSRAYEVVQQKRRMEITRFDLVTKINEIEARKSFELAECCVAAILTAHQYHRECKDILDSRKKHIEELGHKQQRERANFFTTTKQINDKKRQEMIAVLDETVNRVKTSSPYLQNDVIQIPDSSKIYSDSRMNLSHARLRQSTGSGSTPVSASSSASSMTTTTLSSNQPFLQQHHQQSLPQPISTTTYPNSHPSVSHPSPQSSTSTSTSRFSRISALGANIIGGIAKTTANLTSSSTNESSSTSVHNSHNPNLNVNTHHNMSMNMNMNGRKDVRKGGGGGSLTPPPSSSSSHHDDSSNAVIPAATCADSELRLHALDYSKLSSYFMTNPEEEPAGVVIQGYLWKKSTTHKVRQHWNRRWFILDHSKVFYIKENEDGMSHDFHVVCDVMLGTVRELKSFDLPFCFEIVYANLRTTTLQAEGHQQCMAWIDAIRTTIGKRLVMGGPPLRQIISKTTSSVLRKSNPRNKLQNQRTQNQRIRAAALCAEILVSNSFCADCGKSDPDWVSLNLGCLVCIECSGVHRSLGVHISKVRSLTLDDLELEDYELIKRIGNIVSNTIWDCSTAVDENGEPIVKPNPTDSEAIRYKYIRAKYEQRLFLGSALPRITESTTMTMAVEDGNGNGNIEVNDDANAKKLLTTALLEGVDTNDVTAALRALAHGAGLCHDAASSTSSATSRSSSSALHVAAEAGSMACCTLLVLNGFDPFSRDEMGRTPAEVAEQAGHITVSEYLKKRAELLDGAAIEQSMKKRTLDRTLRSTLVSSIRSTNQTCVDCGKSDPDWVSLNLGCLVCIECSGVHRSLGVHISKVRSLTLDDLELEDYELIKRIGNCIVNAIWDCSTAVDENGKPIVKPNPTDSEAIRYKYIRAKYEQRLLLSHSLPRIEDETSADPSTVNCLKIILMAAVEADDVTGAVKALAHGAAGIHDTVVSVSVSVSVSATNTNTTGITSALHVAAEAGSMACCTLLVLNGFDPFSRDEMGRTPAEVAEQAGHITVSEYLKKRAELLNIQSPTSQISNHVVHTDDGVILQSDSSDSEEDFKLESFSESI